MPRERTTYDLFILKSIVAVPGWQAVYYNDEEGIHFAASVELLGLAHRREKPLHGHVMVRGQDPPEDESWEIVALDYSPGDEWTVVQEAANYCGLLRPGDTLESYKCPGWRRHTPRQPTPEPESVPQAGG